MKLKKSLSSALLLSAIVLGTVASPWAVAAETTVATTTEASTTQVETPTTSVEPSTEAPTTTEVPATTVGPTTTEVAPTTTESSTTSLPTTTAEEEETAEQRMKREALEQEFGIDANVLEGIVGKDDQYRIKDTKANPYRKVVRLYMQHPDGVYVGTGTMIAPNLVLTAAHNVYNIDTDKWASKVKVVPAQNGSTAPYGTYTAINYYVLRDYKSVSGDKQYQYDVAVVKLGSNVNGNVGYLPISTGGYAGQRVQIPGYPSYSESKENYMYTMFGSIQNRDGNIFTYKIDTEAGQSGAPVLNSKNQIVGVHIYSYGEKYKPNVSEHNAARRVDSDVQMLINHAKRGITDIKVANYKEKSNTVYRLYHAGIKRHLYTKSLDEANALTKRGWKFEGAKFKTAASGKPVYRLYYGGTREHIYTTNINERDTLRKRGWRYEGVAWYSSGKKPVYRLYHKGLKVHLYTADRNESSTLSKRGWNYEGVAFKVQ